MNYSHRVTEVTTHHTTRWISSHEKKNNRGDQGSLFFFIHFLGTLSIVKGLVVH